MRKKLLNCVSLILVLSFCLFALSSCKKSEEEIEPKSSQTDAAEENLGDLSFDVYYTVRYESVEEGKILGEQEQTVKKGEDSVMVKAIANEGYVFVGWSDGLLSKSRQEKAVSADITVCPVFMKVGTTYSITYKIMEGSRVIEEVTKSAIAGELIGYSLSSTKFAYEVVWDDGQEGTFRTDSGLKDGKTIVGEYRPICLEVPIICINTNDGSAINSKTEYKQGAVTLMNTDESLCFDEVSAKVRGRGNSSWGQDKKSYRIKFDEKRSMMGTGYEAKSWTLIANHSDKTLSRNALAYEFSSLLPNIEFTSINQFVELFINGEYMGMYLLCDQIQTGEGRVDIDETLSGNPDTGYLIEVDNRAKDEGTLGVDYFAADDGKTYTLKTPETDDPNYDPEIYLTYIENYVNQCIAVMNSKDWSEICKYIDVDSFVDTYLVQELFCNLDCHSFSFFLYKEKGGKMYAGPVWDFDISSGNNNYGLGNENECRYDQDLINEGKLWVGSKNQWYKRLLKCDEFVALVKEKLVEYKPLLRQVIDLTETDSKNQTSYYAMYSGAMKRNFERWDIMDKYVWPNPNVLVSKNNTLELQLSYLNEWLHNRYFTVCEYYGV